MLDALVRTVYRLGYRAFRVWWFVRRPHVHGAFVAVWHDGRLLLIRNSYRHGETLPCGRIERGETPRTAACRELREEVGIVAPEDALEPASDFVSLFEFRHDRASVFEYHPAERPTIELDRREVVWGEFVDESALGERPLVPHVVQYLAWRRERTEAARDADA